jgi:hypothetical protein
VSVIPFDLTGEPVMRRTKRSRVWHGFAQSLVQGVDALAACATRHAVCEQALRRADADIKRCRELMARRELPRNVNLARLRIRAVRSKVF